MEAISQDLEQQIAVRHAVAADLPFIYSAWLESYGVNSPTTINIWKSVYYGEQRQVINAMLRHPSVHHAMVVLADDPDVIVGFVIWQPSDSVVHYCYVKAAFRRMGVMREAFQRLEIDLNRTSFTHYTYIVSQLRPKWPKLAYNPYLLMRLTNGIPGSES